MYIQVGKRFIQPRIVFRGKDGRRAFEQILNDKPEPTEYMKTYPERLKMMEEKVMAARSKPDYK